MSWVDELYKTYEACSPFEKELIHPFHMRFNTQIEVRVNGQGEFVDAIREELKNTIIPCTEKSEAARTNNPPPHPLCDKIQFLAGDYKGTKTSYYSRYFNLLEAWANSKFTHPMVNSIYSYIKRKSLIQDLLNTQKNIILNGEDPADLAVRWCVEIPGENEPRTWKNFSLFESWQKYYESLDSIVDVCMVKGEMMVVATNHPKRIRHAGDGAKLISSNDKTGFTFRGRFTTTDIIIDKKKSEVTIQPASISSEVSQKAHRALSWLIDRQGYRNGDQVIVSWSVTGEEKPSEFDDSLSLFGESVEEKIQSLTKDGYIDAGQTFSKKLSKKIAGYRATLTDAKRIVVMGLDSAGPGRISITFYRELAGSEFLGRVEKWHTDMAWYFHEFVKDPNDKKKTHSGIMVYAPAPRVIAEVCFGKRLDEKLKKATIERLLPCIIDARQIPNDLVSMAVRRASMRAGLDKWEWERTLSVACALYNCSMIRENFTYQKTQNNMALDEKRTDRDYLYGRLLAVAEHIEERALYLSKENRETNAARMMHMFSEQPFQTWEKLYDRLSQGYFSRLQTRRPSFLFRMKNLIGEINSLFLPGDFEKKGKLSGLYLLGYHCQRLELVTNSKQDEENIETTINQ